MTLDVTIGKLTISPIETILQAALYGDEDNNEYGIRDHVVDTYGMIDVEACPDSDYDVCNPESTIYPRSSQRSGSTGFWKFFTDMIGSDIYYAMRRNPESNDRDIALIRPLIDKINAIQDPTIVDENAKYNSDRLKWFKFWSNKAVELYGDMAAIEFS